MLCKHALKVPVRTRVKNAPGSECAKVMAEHNIGFLPIVDLVGTDRDLAVRVLGQVRMAHIAVIEPERHVLGVIGLSHPGRLEDPTRAGTVLRSITQREAAGIVGTRE